MKYSEHLRNVRARVQHAERLAICYANQAESFAHTARHAQRLEDAVEQELERLRQATEDKGGLNLAFYPSLLALHMGLISGAEFSFTLKDEWRKKVRLELLDKWIAEAQAGEAS